jgi:exodeoxyribonuclease VII large subunit
MTEYKLNMMDEDEDLMDGAAAEERYTLSEFLEEIEADLESSFSDARWITAEISSITNNFPGGHCYMELVETETEGDKVIAKARATIWREKNRMLTPFFRETAGGDLKQGMKVLIKAKATFSTVYGFSLNIINIEPSFTLGDMEARKQQTLKRLDKEGLMNLNKELAIPSLPCRIAVVSSEGAAGYGDFMKHIKEGAEDKSDSSASVRFKIELFESPMQGSEAPAGIAKAFALIEVRQKEFDIVVLIRGGGSQMDLACFDDYAVAKAIAESPLPVVTGVGHDRDTHICDIVACHPVKTPTAAAAFLLGIFAEQKEIVSSLEERMQKAATLYFERQDSLLERLITRARATCGNYVLRQQNILEQKKLSVGNIISKFLTAKENEIKMLELRLQSSSPMKILEKGYSVIFVDGRKAVSVNDIQDGSHLRILMRDGEIGVIVKKEK